jgi:hypothetical protein
MRVCSCGCGRSLVKPNGAIDYKRRFYSADCKRADLKEKMQGKRSRIIGKRCPLCGRTASHDAARSDGVSRNKRLRSEVMAEVGEIAQG